MPGCGSLSSAEASRTRGRRRMVCERGGFVGRLDSSLSVAGGIASRGGAIVPHSATGAAPRYRPRSNAIADPTERAQMRDSSGVSQCANGVGGSSGGAARRCRNELLHCRFLRRRFPSSALPRVPWRAHRRSRGRGVAVTSPVGCPPTPPPTAGTGRERADHPRGRTHASARSARAACSSASKR